MSADGPEFLLALYSQGQRNFVGARLKGANLSGVVLAGADLRGADLSEAKLHGANLRGANLRRADLHRADLKEADLREASFSEAKLDWADLGGADLTDAYLKRACSRSGSLVDSRTYERSGWDPETLVEWQQAGAIIKDFAQLPETVLRKLLGQMEGLTLYFNTQLTPIDRYLIEGVIRGVLANASDCQVVEFRQLDDAAVVRLQASRNEDLELVADALYRRAWEQTRPQEQALVRMASLFGPREMLSELRTRIERLERQVNQRQAWSWDFKQNRLQLPRPVQLFLSYATKDEPHQDELDGHLATLRRTGVIESWHAGRVQAGTLKDAELQAQLDQADIVVLLVSSDYLRCDGLYEQLQRALTRQAAGEARVIPVLVRPVGLEGCPLEHLQCLPQDGRPVTMWEDRDEAWKSVAASIRMLVLGMFGPQQERPALPRGYADPR